jgi:hypothetical protein
MATVGEENWRELSVPRQASPVDPPLDPTIRAHRTKLESTVRYLGIEIDDALRIAEQIEL